MNGASVVRTEFRGVIAVDVVVIGIAIATDDFQRDAPVGRVVWLLMRWMGFRNSSSRTGHRGPTPRFSYHLRFEVALPIMTMSGRPSPLISATEQPDPDMSSRSTTS